MSTQHVAWRSTLESVEKTNIGPDTFGSHVTLSCVKLFNQLGGSGGTEASGDPTEQNAFGIANDPLVQFALVFSAMIQ